MLDKLFSLVLRERFVFFLSICALVLVGISVSPFDNKTLDDSIIPRNPIASDAIPDLGENQQIVFTKWEGSSPRDIEDQITYPLTIALQGIPRVKTVRSFSMLGFSSIYVIFDEDADFYWSRSRILEKLNSLSPGTLPEGVRPKLGPDATGLGQVYWYTLEGVDEAGEVIGGWDLNELRSQQDWFVRYALSAVDGVSEVASIGGYEQEYLVEVDPVELQALNVDLAAVQKAVRDSNKEVGAGLIEMNHVEYVLRGRGWIKDIKDIEQAPLFARDGTPLRVSDVAHVALGPAMRRGALDRGGEQVVGGVVTARYGENPLMVVKGIKAKIDSLAASMPSRILPDGRKSTLKIIPFYDRSVLINETLGTLEHALSLEIIITIIVILTMLMRLRAAFIVSLTIPISVLGAFALMKYFAVDANLVALAGIAIAIGTIADIGIVLTENILQHLQKLKPDESRFEAIRAASAEVGSAIMTAVLTTILGFLPVFTMTGAEGKLFSPLAYTKTFTLLSAIVVTLILVPILAYWLFRGQKDKPKKTAITRLHKASVFVIALVLSMLLADQWMPLGYGSSFMLNFVFVALMLFSLIGGFTLFHRAYSRILAWCLRYKLLFLSLPLAAVIWGANIASDMGREFMPSLNEGSFLYMPTTMPHASTQHNADTIAELDRAIETIHEVKYAVGKIGRANTPLDPAPMSMVETIIEYYPEYTQLEDGSYKRNWRDHITSADDIWDEIITATKLLGVTSAPKLQPIETRLVMLQSGMRAPMGLKVAAPNVELLEEASLLFEKHLKNAPGIREETVFADRVVGKPYLEVEVRREDAARYGISVAKVHHHLQSAMGGMKVAQTVDGRERYSVRVRYPRELRSSPEDVLNLMIPMNNGNLIPLAQLADVEYRRGPMVLKTEDTFLTAYVIFDRQKKYAEVDVVEAAQNYLAKLIDNGTLVPPAGVTWKFAGSYENQVRANATLKIVLPIALILILLLLYFHFHSLSLTAMVFSGVFVAWSGGFILLWMYNQPWFMDFNLFGQSMRELFAVQPLNLSVAVWVGFLALFGIATDDGVVMGTYLKQSFNNHTIKTKQDIHNAVIEAGMRRIGPCLMTTATTILALLPVITATGRGADLMLPMAIPSIGGMLLAMLTMFVVPVLFSMYHEIALKRSLKSSQSR
ncbi:MAG: efflux RND transporter permease subunit [Planctomycetes bacterium]|nr:efflux RND transporter permease subunit [Planctomycetota bacterium]